MNTYSATATPPPPPPKSTPNTFAHKSRDSLISEQIPATGPPLPPLPTLHRSHSQSAWTSQDPRGLDFSEEHHQQAYSRWQHGHRPHGEEEQTQGYTVEQHQAHRLVSTNALPAVGWVPELLKDISKTDLHHALSTPAILHALLHSPSTTPPSLTASLQPLHDLLADNITLAQHLTTLETSLEKQRATTSAHLLHVRALESQWKRKQKELEERLEVFGPRVLHQRLRASITEAEQSVKAVEESFLEDDGVGDGENKKSEREVGEWVRRVREGRKVVWLRRERRERWDEGRVGGWR